MALTENYIPKSAGVVAGKTTIQDSLLVDDGATVSVASASDTKSALVVDMNGTAGATTEAAVRIDSELVDTGGLYVTSPVDATGTAYLDRHAITSISEGIGGAGYFYRAVASGYLPVVDIHDNSATTDSSALRVVSAGNATNAEPAVAFSTSDAANAQPVLEITQAGTGPLIDNVGGSSSGMKLFTLTEEVTVPVGSGLDPVVVTSGNLAPAGSIITGLAFRVTDAPGGGATTLDIGITAGDLDLLIDGASCDGLGETGDSHTDGAAEWTGIIRNISATTLTLTTDADVTGDNMKIRIVVWYYQITAPTA